MITEALKKELHEAAQEIANDVVEAGKKAALSGRGIQRLEREHVGVGLAAVLVVEELMDQIEGHLKDRIEMVIFDCAAVAEEEAWGPRPKPPT